MTTTPATWEAIPHVLQYGTQPATIEINNLGKQEKLSLKITVPSGESFKLDVHANDEGVVSKELHLLNGVGTYIVELWKETCTEEQLCYDLQPLSIIAQKCKVEDVVNNLQLFCSNIYVPKGLTTELTVVGKPNTPFVISQSSDGLVKPHTGITNQDGIGIIVAEVIGLSDTFIAMQEQKVSNSITTKTPADVNSPALLADTGSELAFTTLKSSLALEQNVAFPLTIQIKNTFDELVLVSVSNVSGSLQQDIPIYMQYEPISSGSTREFTFFLYGQHNEQEASSMNITLTGTYTKPDGSATPWSYSTSVLMPPRKLNSGIMITSLLTEPATITLGETAKIHLDITNIGETDISELELQALQFPDTTGQMNFSNVPLPKGQTYRTTAIIKPTKVDTYLFMVDGTLISGKAQGTTIVGQNELTTSLLVLKK